MSNELIQKLDEKIDAALETIEILRLQLEESENKNKILSTENETLKENKTTWENNINNLLNKLNRIEEEKAEQINEVVS